ncbi:hypothetical protein [Pseudonocardia sp. H11422]|uniref:hypothetical protein n=1 Tax=Pseudonocardia sp. H11422 TaxID=2835866 RepID=UPI001BDD2A21|nr:hypothetical protein [Pseudonocardia sp. H11422]
MAALDGVPAPQSRCTVEDRRLTELSGLIVDRGGLWAMDDGGRRVEVHRLDTAGPTCRVVETRTARIDPFDAEDLARGPDGTLWVADTGDNRRRRETVAFIALPPRGEARLHRLTYPDGPHDAEALLVGADGIPLVVTKEAGGAAGIYRPAGPLAEPGPTPLVQVGEILLPASDTEGGPLGGLGSRLVTGAALSADGRVAALRSYTDAWLYPVTDDDLVAALAGTPVRVPLPDEPQGEAIAFDADGTLLSGSETRGGVRGEIRAVPGAAGLVERPAVRGAREPSPPPAPAVPPATDDPPDWWPAAVGGTGAVGLLALAGVAMAANGARRRRR